MNILGVIIFLLVAACGTAVALTRRPVHQCILMGLYGVLLGILFLFLQAPDVALSEIAIGSVAYPMLILLALAKTRQKGSR